MKILIVDKENSMAAEFDSSKSILENLQLLGLSKPEAPCGGKGSCHKCMVRVSTSSGSREVLACQTFPEGIISIELEKEKEAQIALEGSCRLYQPDGKYSKKEGAYGIALDIGTTTVVCHLHELSQGTRLATASAVNAQKTYGADVISRIVAATEGKLKELQEAIVNQVNQLISEACQKAGVKEEEICRVALAGNTTMQHIFMGLSPESLGKAPFTPLSLFGQEYLAKDAGLKINQEARLYLLPALAAYVGGDITADILATRMHLSEQKILLLDIGTNGEMVLGNREGMLTCATAAGPAFEGAEISMGMSATDGAISKVYLQEENGEAILLYETIGNQKPIGICGSGLLDALACFLELGIIDETGCFADPCELPLPLALKMGEEEDSYYLDKEKTISITQGDIRKLQLAKAAIAAGISVMLDLMNWKVEDIDSLLLAGGFGSYLNPQSAAKVGLIPEELLPVTKSIGNAAGEGAASACISSKAREELKEIQAFAEYEELSTNKNFSKYYMDAMYFE